jgi:competence CoiA-like predicted nuclease
MRQEQEKFYVSEINSISSPTKIIVPITQQNKNKIYVLEKDIKKIVLNQLKEKVNNNLTEYDFIIEFESKYINHTGTVAIELSHSKIIKIKIHGKNNLVGETN